MAALKGVTPDRTDAEVRSPPPPRVSVPLAPRPEAGLA